MKKIFVLLAVCIFVLSLSSCQALLSTPADPETEAAVNASLLSGYPQDILPLYRADALISCGMSCRESDEYDIGKDIYTVNYESTADQQTLIQYYSALLTEQDESPTSEEDVITDQLSGNIGEYKADIMFLDDMDSTTTVYLTLGLPSDQYTDENPYFSDYPKDLVDQYGVSSLLESTYQKQYYDGETLHYITVYQTDLTEDEYAAHYKDAYSSKESFAQSASGAYAFSWQDGAFSVSTRYSGGNVPYVTIDVSKAG